MIKSLHVGLCSYRQVTAPTVGSVISLARSVEDFGMEIRMGALLIRNRDEIVKNFLSIAKQDYLLFIDGDMLFTVENIQTLIDSLSSDSTMGAISGHYLRGSGSNMTVSGWKNSSGDFMSVEEATKIAEKYCEEEKVVEVDAFGAGCLLIDRKALEKLSPPYFSIVNSGEGDFIGEDVFFLQRLKEKGFRPSTHFGVCIGHLVSVVSKPGQKRSYLE